MRSFLASHIAFRYIRAKRKQHFISFVAFASLIGIALGVAVLITVLSVMNGFDKEIKKHFFGMTPEITITDFSQKMTQGAMWQARLSKQKGVVGIAPFIGGQGLLVFGHQTLPAALLGIEPSFEKNINNVGKHIIAGSFDALNKVPFSIVLGRGQALSLGVWVGDKVTVMIPQMSQSLIGAIPRFKQFQVVGIFSAGDGFGFDRELSFIHLPDAQKLFQMGNSITGLRLKIQDIYNAPVLGMQLGQMLPPHFQVSDWTESFGAYFNAIKMEKTMMFLILMLIIGVAVFNLVSSLVMLVNDKRSEIAILRTLGATSWLILRIFIGQGLMIGLMGIILGLVGGLLLSWNATAIVNALESLFHVQLISSNVYFVNYLPSEILLKDVVSVCAIAFGFSLLATLYPAWKASRIQPAEALRYEG